MRLVVNDLVAERHMTTAGDQRRHRAPAHRISKATIAVLAVTIAYVDGFWSTSLQGAVGAIENVGEPFDRWLRGATAMLPVHALAVTGALMLTRRWVAHRRELMQVLTAVLLTAASTTLVSIGETTVRATIDYRAQVRGIELIHADHDGTPSASDAASTDGHACGGACTAAKDATLRTHVRGIGLASIVIAITNLVLVVWGLALRGGRLWHARQPGSAHCS